MVFKSHFESKGQIMGDRSGVQSYKSWLEFQGKRMRSTNVGGQKIISQLKQKANFLLLHLFILFMSSRNWLMPTCNGEGNLLYSVYRFFFFFFCLQILMLISSRNSFTGTPSKYLSLVIWHPLAQQVDA